MGFRFSKRIKIAPGIRVNIGKKSASLSIGRKGATINISEKGIKSTVGIPGTGMSYSENMCKKLPPTENPKGPISSGENVNRFVNIILISLVLLAIYMVILK
jgi:hypothetical protein